MLPRVVTVVMPGRLNVLVYVPLENFHQLFLVSLNFLAPGKVSGNRRHLEPRRSGAGTNLTATFVGSVAQHRLRLRNLNKDAEAKPSLIRRNEAEEPLLKESKTVIAPQCARLLPSSSKKAGG